jgi:hypothetical protein
MDDELNNISDEQLKKLSPKDFEYVVAGKLDKVSDAGLDILSSSTSKPDMTIGRGAGLVARGMASPVIGATAGGALGGPVGAVAGSLAVPAADLLTAGYNALAPQQYNIAPPSEAIGNLLTKAGLPVPQTTGERALVTGSSMLGGTGGQIGALRELGKTGATALGRGIASQLSQQPVRQVAASFPAGYAAQYAGEKTTEATGSPALGGLASLAAIIPVAGAVSKMGDVTQNVMPKMQTLADKAGLPVKFPIAESTQEVIPTIESLKQQAGQQYKFAEDAGAVFKKNSFKTFADSLEPQLRKEGFNVTLHPGVFAALKEIKDAAKTDVTLENAEILRRIGNAAKSSISADERRVGGVLIDKLDDFIEGAQPNQLKSGSKEAVDALVSARDLWKRSRKGDILQEIFDTAELRADANFSQSGMEQALRSRLVNLATNAKKMRTFTKEEQAAIKDTAKGGSIQNILRWAGKYSPTSAIATASGSYVGASLLGPAGAIIAPAVGLTARYGATKMGLKNFKDLQNQLLLGRKPITEISPYATTQARTLGGLLSQDPFLQRLQNNEE